MNRQLNTYVWRAGLRNLDLRVINKQVATRRQLQQCWSCTISGVGWLVSNPKGLQLLFLKALLVCLFIVSSLLLVVILDSVKYLLLLIPSLLCLLFKKFCTQRLAKPPQVQDPAYILISISFNIYNRRSCLEKLSWQHTETWRFYLLNLQFMSRFWCVFWDRLRDSGSVKLCSLQPQT